LVSFVGIPPPAPPWPPLELDEAEVALEEAEVVAAELVVALVDEELSVELWVGPALDDELVTPGAPPSPPAPPVPDELPHDAAMVANAIDVRAKSLGFRREKRK